MSWYLVDCHARATRREVSKTIGLSLDLALFLLTVRYTHGHDQQLMPGTIVKSSGCNGPIDPKKRINSRMVGEAMSVPSCSPLGFDLQ